MRPVTTSNYQLVTHWKQGALVRGELAGHLLFLDCSGILLVEVSDLVRIMPKMGRFLPCPSLLSWEANKDPVANFEPGFFCSLAIDRLY